MSTFVWLDYSERERRKMLDMVDLFREHDTRDELGIGSVRDAFADILFPGSGFHILPSVSEARISRAKPLTS